MVSVKTARRLRMLNQKLTSYSANPRSIPKEEREDIAMMMAAALSDFREFAYIGMRFLGFTTCRPTLQSTCRRAPGSAWWPRSVVRLSLH